MAVRRPSISSPQWLFQDFLYQDTPEGQERYTQVKWDGDVYTRVSQSFDYSNPPYSNSEQRGGSIVAQVDYTVEGKIVTINEWDVNWRDEWPLRLAANYLTNCLYPPEKGYVVRVRKDPYAFWVSERIFPVSNDPSDFLFR